MTTATEFKWITPVDEYVMRQKNNSGWLKVTWSNNKDVAVEDTYIPLPLGNIDLLVTWEGVEPIRVYYLPDGEYNSKQEMLSFTNGVAHQPQTQRLPLAVDDPAAKIYVVVAPGQSAYAAGIKVIKTTIDFKEQEE